MYRIIIADDEPIMHKALMALVDWKGLGCEVVKAVLNGRALIDCLQKESPDIVISDIKMPKCSGIDAARHIFENNLPIKVILLTAYADFSYAQQAIRYGVTEYVTKTGAVTGIAEAVGRCVQQIKQKESSLDASEGRVTDFLKSVLDGSLYDYNIIENKVALYNIDFKTAMLLRLELSGSHDAASMSDEIESPKQLMQTVLSESKLFFIPLKKLSQCVVVCDPSGDIRTKCREMAQTYTNLTGKYIHIGISGKINSLHMIPAAFEEAEMAFEQRFFNHGQLVYAHKPPADDHQSEKAVNSVAASLEMAVTVGNDALANQLASQVLKLQKLSYSVWRVKTEGLLIITRLEIIARHNCESFDESEFDQKHQSKVESFCFFEDYAEYFLQFVSKCCRVISASLKQGGSLVTNASLFIEKNYCRPLTLTEIADAVGANPSYLSRMFKEKTGVNIINAVNNKKISRAQAMLDAGGMKICDVAAHVGIEDTTYFSHLFRKHTGISPRAYQDNQYAKRSKSNDS